MQARKVSVAVLVSLGIVGLALLLFLSLRGPGELAPGEVAAPGGPPSARGAGAAGGAPRPAARPQAATAEDEAAKKDGPEEVDAGPPLFRGRVAGEGRGIAGATVRIFPTKGVERAIERLERVIPQGGSFPDIQGILAAVREELEAIRGSGKAAATGAEGLFEFRKVEPGSYLVLATAEGWLFRFGDVVSLSRERTQELEIALDRGTSIAGRVVDEGGAAVPGVPVVAEFRPGGAAGIGTLVRRLLRYVNGEFLRGPFQATTAADGSFTLSSLPPGLYDLAAQGPQGVESRLRGVETGAEEALIYLGKGGVVAGKLTDQAGAPAAGVALRLERQDDLLQIPLPMAAFGDAANAVNRLIAEPPRAARSARDGGFRMAALSAGTYRLSVEDRGFLPYSRPVEVGWGQSLNLGLLRLDRGESISGTVKAEDGRPLDGARIHAAPAQVNPFTMGGTVNDFLSGRTSAAADAAGSFTLAGLARGKYRLSAALAGYAPATRKSVDTGGEPVAFVLRAGSRLSGIVVDAADGKPVNGARVEAGGVRGAAGEDGKFSLEGVVAKGLADEDLFGVTEMAGIEGRDGAPGTTVKVKASAPGYRGGSEEVDLAQGPGEIELKLDRLPEVRGAVVDPEGKPAPGSLVRLVPDQKRLDFPPGIEPFDRGLIFLAATVSDLEGKFRFPSFRVFGDQTRCQVIADHPLHARGTSEAFELEDAKAGGVAVEVKLVAASRIRGVVTGGHEPVAGALVRLQRSAPEGGREAQMGAMLFGMLGFPKGGETAYTSREGRFEFSRVAPGSYTLTAEKAGFSESPPQAVALPAGEVREVSLAVDPGHEIAGEVADPQGSPVPGARVRLFLAKTGEREGDQLVEAQKFLGGAYRSTRSAEDGSFALRGLPPGRYSLLAEEKGYTAGKADDVDAGGRRARIVLVPAAGLRGVVADAASGRPIGQFRVQVKRVDGDADDPLQSFEAATGGREHQDPEGKFVRDDLAGGKYEVRVAAAGYAPSRREVFLNPGTFAEAAFPLAQAGRIRGVVLHLETQAPIAGARIALGPPPSLRKEKDAAGNVVVVEERVSERPEDPARDDARAMGEHFSREWMGAESANSRDDGSFLLDGVPEGLQAVVVTHPEFVGQVKEGVEVGLGQEIEASFSLRPGLTVSGRVVGPPGSRLQGRMVFARGTGEQNRRTRKSALSGAAGEFRIAGLEPGPYRVFLPESMRVDGASGATDFQVRPGAVELDLGRDESAVELKLPEKDPGGDGEEE